MRKRIFEIIELAREGDRASNVYDVFMMVTICLSLLPLMFKETTPLLHVLDQAAVVIFILDYLLRWSTADYKFGRHNAWSFLRYPFSLMAIIDLLSILPSLSILNASFKVLRVLRLMRAMRVFRVLRAMRYSKSIRIIGAVLKRSKTELIAVGTLAVAYILISALVIFNSEPDSFDDFFEAVYWATVLLTTVGYGDIYPVTTIGRAIAMVSSLFGIAIVALPAGIITAGYMKELEKEKLEDQAQEVRRRLEAETARQEEQKRRDKPEPKPL